MVTWGLPSPTAGKEKRDNSPWDMMRPCHLPHHSKFLKLKLTFFRTVVPGVCRHQMWWDRAALVVMGLGNTRRVWLGPAGAKGEEEGATCSFLQQHQG